jgi:hypothetical protein
MLLIAETGMNVAGANSYATVPEADAYFTNHPYYADNWEALGTTDKERLLVSASAQLDAMITWRGRIYSPNQNLAWPRVGVVDDEGRVISAQTVPYAVKRAVYELAFAMSRGDQFAASASAGLEKLKIDVIELQFAASTVTAPVPAAALLALKGLGTYAFGSRVRKVLVS